MSTLGVPVIDVFYPNRGTTKRPCDLKKGGIATRL